MDLWFLLVVALFAIVAIWRERRIDDNEIERERRRRELIMRGWQ